MGEHERYNLAERREKKKAGEKGDRKQGKRKSPTARELNKGGDPIAPGRGNIKTQNLRFYWQSSEAAELTQKKALMRVKEGQYIKRGRSYLNSKR